MLSLVEAFIGFFSGIGIPCLTLRSNTGRPITVTRGTNRIVGNSKSGIIEAANSALNGGWKEGRVPELWDGRTAERIVGILLNIYT